MYMLDTNICIYIIKRKPQVVLEKFKKMEIGELFISSIVEAELRYGADKSQYPAKNHAALDLFLNPFTVLPFDSSASQAYGRIRAELEKRGKPIGAYDMLIGAHALSVAYILITNNLREFKRIKGLICENWVS